RLNSKLGTKPKSLDTAKRRSIINPHPRIANADVNLFSRKRNQHEESGAHRENHWTGSSPYPFGLCRSSAESREVRHLGESRGSQLCSRPRDGHEARPGAATTNRP